MASWTAVRVRERGRFCFWVLRERALRLGRGRMRREARIRTWRSENFFSSSRVRLNYVSTSIRRSGLGRECLPLLDAVEASQGGDGDKDDNSLLAVANLDLFKIQSQHASSRTVPWTASRPVPQKSIVLRSIRESLVPMLEVLAASRPPSILRPSRRVFIAQRLWPSHGDLGRLTSSPLSFVFWWNRISKEGSAKENHFAFVQGHLTSRAETICRGRRATLRSAVLVSRS
jgi:hypothetical protein